MRFCTVVWKVYRYRATPRWLFENYYYRADLSSLVKEFFALQNRGIGISNEFFLWTQDWKDGQLLSYVILISCYLLQISNDL